MIIDQTALDVLLAKDEIRELAMLYSRGVDRKDGPLLRTLYTRDGVDLHDETYRGSAEGFVDFLERSFPYMRYSGHHICNHLISVQGEEAEGEVYAACWHIIPDGQGGWLEDFGAVRYVDRYRKEEGRWRFAQRAVTYDMRTVQPFTSQSSKFGGDAPEMLDDPSYTTLKHRLFARGPRA